MSVPPSPFACVYRALILCKETTSGEGGRAGGAGGILATHWGVLTAGESEISLRCNPRAVSLERDSTFSPTEEVRGSHQARTMRPTVLSVATGGWSEKGRWTRGKGTPHRMSLEMLSPRSRSLVPVPTEERHERHRLPIRPGADQDENRCKTTPHFLRSSRDNRVGKTALRTHDGVCV